MSHLSKSQLDVAKDPLDLRDLYYEGSLVESPRWIDNRGNVPFILDQGNEGACTGFGLAAVVNYLMHTRAGADILISQRGASARMLYEMAKRYDEWEGSNYDGSSIRGAMKGWHKHGVCSERIWPYKKNAKNERLTASRQLDALSRPLGNYYRVRHLHLSHMHSALAEADILYASASVHEGWDEVDSETGIIPFSGDVAGGHAFSIVGYNDIGFWIQNSWGRDWGRDGFALLTYDDWLENGWDCWVARMGVATRSYALSEGGKLGRALQFDFVPHTSFVAAEVKPHCINLGNDGQLSDSGKYQTDEEDISEILNEHIPEVTSDWSKPTKLVLYAHGGLNNEKSSAQRVASFRPYFLANQIYPLHFMWETGFWNSINGIVLDAFRDRRFGSVWDEVKDRFYDLADEAIELASRSLGRPIWAQMKQNAEAASQEGGGADFLAGQLSDGVLNGADLELHLVGHSAGSILLGHLVPEIWRWGLKIKTLTLYAPACTTDFFISNYLPYLGSDGCIESIAIFNLNEEHEQADNVSKVYHKSLLYLVSEAFEHQRKQPILGIDRHLNENDSVDAFFGKPVYKGRSTIIYSNHGNGLKLRSYSKTHGGFDNDPDTLNSTLRIILGSNELVKEFPKNSSS